MRSLYLAVALGSVSLGLLGWAPQESAGCPPGFSGPGVTCYYAPFPAVHYYAPPVYYYPAPMYSPPAQPAATARVGAYDNYFEPKTLNIRPETTVYFVNYGRHVHTVTAKDGSWDSGDLPPAPVNADQEVQRRADQEVQRS